MHSNNPQMQRSAQQSLVHHQPTDSNNNNNIFLTGISPAELLPPPPHSYPLSSSIGSIYSTNIITNQHPYLAVPQVYYSQPHQPAPRTITMTIPNPNTNNPTIPTSTTSANSPSTVTVDLMTQHTEDLLFYLIHGPQYEATTTSSSRYLALKEIFSRGWSCHFDEKSLKDACNNLWVLPINTQQELSMYSYHDLNGAAQYQSSLNNNINNNSTSGMHNKTNPSLFLMFNPDKWTFSFTQQVFKSKTISLEELLK